MNLHNGLQSFSYTSASIAVHPSFVNINSGNDIAIITLNQVADPSIQRLSLYTGSSELNQLATVVGLGRQGKGTTGWTTGSFLTSNGLLQRRQGTNVVDSITGTVLMFDFDDPLNAARSTIGSALPTAHEAILALGDSGGPVLIDGKIAGINSFISCLGGITTICSTAIDVNGDLNSSYGERWGATRVSVFTSWLNSQMGQATSDPLGIPEPSSWAMMIGALGAGLYRLRSRRGGAARN